MKKEVLPVSGMQNSNYFFKIIQSPIGPLSLTANSKALLSLSWGEEPYFKDLRINVSKNNKASLICHQAEDQLNEYFIGKRKYFKLPLDPIGSPFQKKVWHELLKIPYGHCITYGEQARRIQNPKATRAVGAANGKNPIGIIIPCHRVIGASGSLTGFAGGLELKRKLLKIENLEFS